MKTQLIFLALPLLILGACSSQKPAEKPVIYPNESPEVSTTNPKQTSITAKQVASEQGTNFVTEVKFQKGKSAVDAKNFSIIKAMYEKAKKKGSIQEVQLITWGDEDFPTGEKSELAQKQQDLVEKRNDSLTKSLKKLQKDIEVQKISMAERASALERFTGTKEAQVKETLDVKEAPGKASEAMVIFIPKQ